MPAPPGEPTPIAGQGYELVFEDDFDTFNTDVWVPPPAHLATFDPGKISVADSIMTITADQTDPIRDYVELWSLGPQSPIGNGYPRYPDATVWQEGYFEVRCRVTDDPWTKLALWMFSLEDKNTYGLSTRDYSRLNCEWDMVENGIRNWEGTSGYANVSHVSPRHRNTNSPGGIPNQQTFYVVAGSDLCNWHTWGGKWTGTFLGSYLDGVLLASHTAGPYDSFSQPMPFIIGSYPTPNPPLGSPAKPPEIVTDYDYFRVWQQPKNRKRSTYILSGTSGDYASTPHHASLAITGDIDIRCEFSAADPTPAAVQALVNRASTGNWSYQLALRSDGRVRLAWSADGTNVLSADSNILTIVPGQRLCFRAALDVDNGSAQRVTTFYTAPSRDGPWTQLNQVTTAGATSIFAGTRALEFGSRNSGIQEQLIGSIYWAEVRAGIDGTVVSRFDVSDKTPGDITWTDENGKIYTVFGAAKIMPGTPKPDLYRTVSSLRLA
jgi:hypothetical protein